MAKSELHLRPGEFLGNRCANRWPRSDTTTRNHPAQPAVWYWNRTAYPHRRKTQETGCPRTGIYGKIGAVFRRSAAEPEGRISQSAHPFAISAIQQEYISKSIAFHSTADTGLPTASRLWQCSSGRIHPPESARTGNGKKLQRAEQRSQRIADGTEITDAIAGYSTFGNFGRRVFERYRSIRTTGPE